MLLKITNLGFSYDEQPIIKNFSKEISAGDVIHLCGDNGRGKSTLLKLVAGILAPDQGSIEGTVEKAFVGHVLGLHPDLSVLNNIIYGFKPVSLSLLDNLLKETHLLNKKHQRLRTLSKGQGQKIALIHLLLQQPQLWLLDEPFANLDKASETWLWNKMQAGIEAGVAIVFTAHRRQFNHQGIIEWEL